VTGAPRPLRPAFYYSMFDVERSMFSFLKSAIVGVYYKRHRWRCQAHSAFFLKNFI
jgi:hypothetical protein